MQPSPSYYAVYRDLHGICRLLLWRTKLRSGILSPFLSGPEREVFHPMSVYITFWPSEVWCSISWKSRKLISFRNLHQVFFSSCGQCSIWLPDAGNWMQTCSSYENTSPVWCKLTVHILSQGFKPDMSCQNAPEKSSKLTKNYCLAASSKHISRHRPS